MGSSRFFYLSSSLLAVVACSDHAVQSNSSSSGGSAYCSAGNERCACYGNNTCNGDLECHSGLCVTIGNGGGTGSGGASSVATGGAVGGGGFVVSGGAVASGGNNATGGATGGAKATGGFSSIGATTVATGGKVATTGSATGGAGVLARACPGLAPTSAAAGASSTNPDAGSQCTGIGIEMEPSPLDMLIMMDRTLSMTYTMGTGSAITRWDVLQASVQEFVADPGVLRKAPRVGLQFFGATGNPADPLECDPLSYAKLLIEIENINTSGQKILDAVVKERDYLGGQTPWSASLQGALVHAQDWQVANPNRKTVVVFVTDGYPTECDTDVSHIQELVGEYYLGISGAYNTRGQPGIRTYMIGVAVDKFNLNAVAQAGGTGQATIVDSAGGVDALVSAMVNITNANISCDIGVPSPPSGQVLDPSAIQVVYNPFVGSAQEIPRVDSAVSCGGPNGGWYYNNPVSPTKITLCPCSCANLGFGKLDLRFGCPAQRGIN